VQSHANSGKLAADHKDTVVVLTDAAAIKELLKKWSSTTADRPPSYVAELITDGPHMILAHFSCV
jgi:hypothetical protein